MRSLHEWHIDRHRDRSHAVVELYGSVGDSRRGRFLMSSPVDSRPMLIIASNGEGWDHISVSRKDRIPLWVEMDAIKRVFFYDHETVMQLHVPTDQHININNNVLHLWRPHFVSIPLPPIEFV